MSVRDREVLELLRDEPELLAIADSVAETVAPRHIRPGRALLAVAVVATALFALVLASPWDRGGGGGGVLGRALGAIDSEGPILHLTTRAELTPGGRRFAPIVSERFYDKQRHLVRVVSRIDDKVEADYTTKAVEDAFSTFPGLLDQADFYRKALASGRAKLVDKGEWQGNTVYWLELQKGGGFILGSVSTETRIARLSSRLSTQTGRRPGFSWPCSDSNTCHRARRASIRAHRSSRPERSSDRTADRSKRGSRPPCRLSPSWVRSG